MNSRRSSHSSIISTDTRGRSSSSASPFSTGATPPGAARSRRQASLDRRTEERRSRPRPAIRSASLRPGSNASHDQQMRDVSIHMGNRELAAGTSRRADPWNMPPTIQGQAVPGPSRFAQLVGPPHRYASTAPQSLIPLAALPHVGPDLLPRPTEDWNHYCGRLTRAGSTLTQVERMALWDAHSLRPSMAEQEQNDLRQSRLSDSNLRNLRRMRGG